MKRPGYREAIDWLACNDDNEWVEASDPIISVAAAMVRDLYDVPDAKLFGDLRKRARIITHARECAKTLLPGENR